jgi:hypothetical protein
MKNLIAYVVCPRAFYQSVDGWTKPVPVLNRVKGTDPEHALMRLEALRGTPLAPEEILITHAEWAEMAREARELRADMDFCLSTSDQ